MDAAGALASLSASKMRDRVMGSLMGVVNSGCIRLRLRLVGIRQQLWLACKTAEIGIRGGKVLGGRADPRVKPENMTRP